MHEIGVPRSVEGTGQVSGHLAEIGARCERGTSVISLEFGEKSFDIASPHSGVLIAIAPVGAQVSPGSSILAVVSDFDSEDGRMTAERTIMRSLDVDLGEGPGKQNSTRSLVVAEVGYPDIVIEPRAEARLKRLKVDPLELVARLGGGNWLHGVGKVITDRHVDQYLGLGATLAIVGAGHDLPIVLDIIKSCSEMSSRKIMLFDDRKALKGQMVGPYQVGGSIDDLHERSVDGQMGAVVIAFLHKKRAEAFKKIYSLDLGIPLVPLLHSSVAAAASSSVGLSVLVGQGSSLGTDVSVGAASVIGQGVSVGHFSRIGEYCEICDGTVIGEGVQIADGVRIGMGSRIANGVRLGKGLDLKPGSLIVRDDLGEDA